MPLDQVVTLKYMLAPDQSPMGDIPVASKSSRQQEALLCLFMRKEAGAEDLPPSPSDQGQSTSPTPEIQHNG